MPGAGVLILGLVAIGVALRPRRWWEPLALGAAVVLPWWAGLAGIAAGIWVALRQSGAPTPTRRWPTCKPSAPSCEREGASAKRWSMPALGRPIWTWPAWPASAAPAAPCSRWRELRPRRSREPVAWPQPRCGSAPRAEGRVSAAFATLAGIQTDRIELQREVRAAGSAARASVAVLTVLPVGADCWPRPPPGSLSDLMSMGSVGPVLVGLGAVLLIGGAAVTLLLGRKLS